MSKKSKNESVADVSHTILYPLKLDRVGNPISTIHRNLAVELTKESNYKILSFANKSESILSQLVPEHAAKITLLSAPSNKYADALIITVKSILNLKKWDAIHLPPNPALLFLALVASFSGKKIITTIHESPKQSKKRFVLVYWILQFFALLANRCTSVSKFVSNQAVIDWRVSSTVIPNGVDTHYFSPIHANRDLIVKKYGVGTKGEKIVLFVGALIEGKGAEIVAETCSKLPNVSCLIIGNGPLKGKITEYCKQHTNIKQIDFISPLELRVMYASSDVLFFPSSIDSFGLVYLEALASGIPVLSVYEAAAPEIIKSQELGILVRTKSAFVVSLSALLKVKTHKNKLVSYVKNNYSWEKVTKEYKAIYNAVFL